jgi:hypothetical protein
LSKTINEKSLYEWRNLHTAWSKADAAANKLDHELMVALRLCVESEAHGPSAVLIDEVDRARRKATACREAADRFVDHLFVKR